MKAAILAGGYGKRLRPLTDNTPKTLIEIAGKPIIEWQITWLMKCGADSFVILAGYLGTKLEEHLNKKKKEWGVEIRYSHEKEPLGTGGALKNAESLLKGEKQFVMLNGDNITNIDIRRMKLSGTLADIALVPLKSPYGIAVMADHKIAEFREKPQLSEYWVNAGVYLMSGDIMEHVPRNGNLEQTTFVELARKGQLGGTKFSDAYWKGVDSIKDVEEANSYLSGNKVF